MDSNTSTSSSSFHHELHTHSTNNGSSPSYHNLNRVLEFIDLTDDGIIDLTSWPNELVPHPNTQNAQNRTDPDVITLTDKDSLDSDEMVTHSEYPMTKQEIEDSPVPIDRPEYDDEQHPTRQEIEDYHGPFNRLSVDEQNLTNGIALDAHNSHSPLPVVVDNEDQSLLCAATTSYASNRCASPMDLNEELESLQKKITDLENTVVDLNDDNNSIYLHIDVYKSRACQIYERIKKKSGMAKKRMKVTIKFDGTQFPEFNKKLEKYANKNKRLPMFENVLTWLNGCNQTKNLTQEECYKLAHSSLSIIGGKLQNQRNKSLYETFAFYTNNQTDPAEHDPELRAKLNRNSIK